MISNQPQLRVAVLLLLVTLCTSMVSAQIDSASMCHAVPTEYSVLTSRWDWLDNDTVVFSVSPGNPPDGFIPNPIVWYRYHPSTDLLEQLEESPYQTPPIAADQVTDLTNLQAGEDGLYEEVQISPSGSRFVYPRADQDGASYWFVDTETGIQIDLEIAVNNISLTTFWSSDEHRFTVQGNEWPNSVVPIQLVTIQGQNATVERLSDIPPLSEYGVGFRDSGFWVMGLSPDGRYVILQPETADYLIWLLDLNLNEVTTLNFRSRGEMRVIWISPNTFIALTDMGVIQYEIETQNTNILATPEEIGLDSLGYGSLSPDGHFLLGYRSGENGNVDSNLVVCDVS